MAKRLPEVILIDGRNYIYRHGFTRRELSSRGRPTGALFGGLHGLLRLNRLYPDAAIVFCWDGHNSSKSWRHMICPSYKSNRVTDKTKKVNPDVANIRKQIPIFEKLVKKTLKLKSFSVPRLEADDLIGVMATELKKTHSKVIIYSTDRDFYQLIKDNIVVVRDLDKTRKAVEITAKEIKKEYGVYPKDWLKYRAFVGDAGDRIDKPIKGIGGVKALKILAAGVDASKAKPHPDYKEHWPAIRLAYKLSKIARRTDYPPFDQAQRDLLCSIIALPNMFRYAKSKKAYDRFVEFLADYDLEQIMEHRHQLWSIK